MKHLYMILIALCALYTPPAYAGGGAPAQKSSFNWEESPIKDVASQFVNQVSKGDFNLAYDAGSPELRALRTLEEFTQDMKDARFEENSKSRMGLCDSCSSRKCWIQTPRKAIPER